MLVAIATVAVAWLVWTRADGTVRNQDDRAAQTVNETLQNSVGRVLTSLRVAAGARGRSGAGRPRELSGVCAGRRLDRCQRRAGARRNRARARAGSLRGSDRQTDLRGRAPGRAARRRRASLVRADRVGVAGGRREDGTARVRPGERPRAPAGDRACARHAPHDDVHRRHPIRAAGAAASRRSARSTRRTGARSTRRVRDDVVQPRRDRRRSLPAAAGRPRTRRRGGHPGVRDRGTRPPTGRGARSRSAARTGW